MSPEEELILLKGHQNKQSRATSERNNEPVKKRGVVSPRAGGEKDINEERGRSNTPWGRAEGEERKAVTPGLCGGCSLLCQLFPLLGDRGAKPNPAQGWLMSAPLLCCESSLHSPILCLDSKLRSIGLFQMALYLCLSVGRLG